MELTRRHISLMAAGVLLAPALFRIPVPAEQMRSLMRVSAQVALCLCLAGFVAWKVNEWIGAFLALGVFSWIWAFRIGDPTHQRIACLAMDALILGAGALLLFRYAEWKWIRLAFIVIGLANLVFIFMQTMGVDPFRVFTFGLMKFPAKGAAFPGLMTNRNETSILFVLCLFASMPNKALAGLMFVGLCLSKSTGGFLALAVGMWVCGGGRMYWLVSGAVLAVALVLAFDKPGVEFMSSAANRVEIWSSGADLLMKRPFLGIGLGFFPLGANQLHAHNDIFQSWIEMGYLSPVFIAGYVISVFSRFTERVRCEAAGLAALLVNSMVSFPLHIPVLGLMGLALVGVLEKKLQGEK